MNPARMRSEQQPLTSTQQPGTGSRNRKSRRSCSLLGGLLCLGALAGCSDSSDQPAQWRELEARIATLEAALAKPQPIPGASRLGNIMAMVQLRHGKLWFAGEQSNWPLAAYELHELEEDFEDVEKFHPTHGAAQLPLGPLVAQFVKPAATTVKQAIDVGDRAKFTAGFDALSASCNTCHAATGVPFNVIQRPASSLLSNQDFTPRQPGATGSGPGNPGNEAAADPAIRR